MDVFDVPQTVCSVKHYKRFSQAAISAFLETADVPHTWKQANTDWLLIMHGKRGRL